MGRQRRESGRTTMLRTPPPSCCMTRGVSVTVAVQVARTPPPSGKRADRWRTVLDGEEGRHVDNREGRPQLGAKLGTFHQLNGTVAGRDSRRQEHQRLLGRYAFQPGHNEELAGSSQCLQPNETRLCRPQVLQFGDGFREGLGPHGAQRQFLVAGNPQSCAHTRTHAHTHAHTHTRTTDTTNSDDRTRGEHATAIVHAHEQHVTVITCVAGRDTRTR